MCSGRSCRSIGPMSAPKHAMELCQHDPILLEAAHLTCKKCLRSPVCSFPGCPLRAAPRFGKSAAPAMCATHYADPSQNASRAWAVCRNADAGCRLLALRHSGGKCYPCSNGNVPCTYALIGCPQHVPSGPGKRLACRSDRGTCPFNPDSNIQCISPWCTEKPSSSADRRCRLCAAGTFPCHNKCSRRCIPGTAGYCQT